MKKYLTIILLTLVALGTFGTDVYAESYNDYTSNGSKGAFTVTFNGTALVSDYDADALNAYLSGMQPSDEATVEFILKNNYSQTVLWWMTNDTNETFENDKEYNRDSVSGGNYTYKVTYNGSELYNSDLIGGEVGEGDQQGLDGATNSLDQFFFELGDIAPGQSKSVTLYFKLDGETQKNNYQDVLGKLMVQFGVELPNNDKEERITYIYVPYTGDSSRLALYVVLELLLLLILLAVTWRYIAYRRKQEAR